MLTQAGRGLQAHGACDARGLIGEDVSKRVLGHYHVEEGRLREHAHRGVVYEHIVGLHLGIQRFHLLGYLPPQTGTCQHVGLVHHGEVLAAAHGEVEGHFQYALYLRAGVDVGVIGLVVVLVLLAEVHASRQLADDHEVRATQDVLLQGTHVEQAVEGGHGAHVGEETQLLPHGQQALLRAHLGGRIIVKAEIAHGGEEHGVGLHAGLVGILGERVSHLVYGVGTANGFLVVELMSELAGNSVKHGHALLHDFWPDAITGQYSDIQFHV